MERVGWEGGWGFGRTAWTHGWEKKKRKKEGECRQPGSNQRPSDLQSDALPTELYRRVMGHGEAGTGRRDRAKVVVKRGHEGIEPSTSPTLKENHTTRPMARTSTFASHHPSVKTAGRMQN